MELEVKLLLPTLADNDGVGNDVLGMYRFFRQRGISVCIYSDHCHSAIVKASPVSDLLSESKAERSLLIYHFSIGWEKGISLFSAFRGPKLIKYHNVTPPEFFLDISDDYARVCREGREELAKLARTNADLFLGDSEYNVKELVSKGANSDRVATLPPFHQVDELLSQLPDTSMMETLSDGRRNLLMVGRFAPNKGHLDLVDAFAEYVYSFDSDARLFIVGRRDLKLSKYVHAVEQQVTQFGLGNHVEFLDGVDVPTLKALYMGSNAFVLCSHHEGFCVPLIEAMALGLPIVAYGTTAVSETAAGVGLVWETSDPVLLATSIWEIVSRPEVKRGLVALGQKRYLNDFATDAIERRFVALLRRIGIDVPA